jgi:repressor LexA
MISLTPQQAQALSFVREYLADHGYAPSYDEIAACLGITKSGVNRVIRALEERGRIRRWPGRSRALEVIEVSAARVGTAAEHIAPGDAVMVDVNGRVWRVAEVRK